jgi:hypothetical protein
MERLSDSHHFRKTVAGACMILASLLFLVGVIVHPEMDTDNAAQLAIVQDNMDAWYISNLLLFASLVLFVPAVLGLMHMLREREAAFGHLGGGLTLLGIVSAAGAVGMAMVVWQMAAPGADQAQMTALLDRVTDTAGTAIPFLWLNLCVGIGIVLVALGLYRARAVQSWMAVFLLIGGVCATIAFPLASELLAIVGGAFLFVSLGAIGRVVLTETDADWEHTPEYKGFRPLAGMR